MTDQPPCRYHATCRCGRTITTVAPTIQMQKTRWIRCGECGAVCASEDRSGLSRGPGLDLDLEVGE